MYLYNNSLIYVYIISKTNLKLELSGYNLTLFLEIKNIIEQIPGKTNQAKKDL